TPSVGSNPTPTASETPLILRAELQPEQREGRRAVCVGDFDPVVLVPEAHEEVLTGIPAHSEAKSVGEPAVGRRRLPARAEVTPPRIPPAPRLRRPGRDVGIDKRPAKVCAPVRGQRTWEEVVSDAATEAADLGGATQSGTRLGRYIRRCNG